MKPLAVDMRAFGPFALRKVVDFRELGSKTFFLIHGPTGSGKTSILDGICFALFGDSSGGEREGRQMRSHHADDGTLTEVRFDFALGDQRYRVHRIPEQMRKAKRGGGETRQLQKAELWQLEPSAKGHTERPLASGWSKVTEAIVALLGFESQQFRQVIMLPQGKFFEFLKSNSQERERILQTLFGTELYKRIEDQLKRTANEVSGQAEKVRNQRQALLDQAQAEHEAAVQARREQQAEVLKSAEAADRATAAAAKSSEQRLVETRRVHDKFDEFDKAAGALQGLVNQEPAWTAKRTQLARARQAAAIHPYAEHVAGPARQLEAEGIQARKLASDLVSATKAQKVADDAVARERLRAPEIEKAIARVSELDALVDKVTALNKARTDAAAAATQATNATSAAQSAERAMKDAQAAQQKLSADVQALRIQAAGLDGKRQTHTRLGKELDQVTMLAARTAELAASTKKVAERRSALKAAEAARSTATKSRDEVRQAWISGQAARLAIELADGKPCPVCGASEHPTPAHAGGAVVHDDRLKAAEDACTRADSALRDAEQKLAEAQQAAAAIEARAAELRSTLGGSPPSVEQLKAQAAAALAALTTAESASKALKPLELKLPAADLAVGKAETASKTATTAAAEAHGQLQRLTGQLAEREAGIPADLRDASALLAARNAAVKTRDGLRQAMDAASTAASQATNRLTDIRARVQACEQLINGLAAQHKDKASDLDARFAAAGFADVQAYAAARLDEQAIVVLDKDIRAYDDAVADARGRHDRATAETRDLQRPDLAAMVTQNEGAKAAQLAASNAVRDTLAALNATTGYDDSLKRLLVQFQALEARYAVLKQVADVANGINPQRMSFQRYVLATLLDEVLAATTLRLTVMSRGRYEIRRRIQAADQRMASGLDLEVFDQYTGTTRAISTLSGGESFLASLALALGLSDVVQSYAGGIRLDAIFVDEGFGTLDPEALDFAIRALKDLQQAGRMVGIISHVAELKEWIDARLELKATQAGSVAGFVL